MEQLILADSTWWQRPSHGIAKIMGKAARNTEVLLANIEQEPSDFLQDALLPVMKGLIAEALFKHSNEVVRVAVASCFSEILRITSPEQPYNDDQMKAVFQLIVEALSKLSQPSTQCYEKALSVLQNISSVKACLLMLDLDCKALVLQMCQQFWLITRSNPSANASWAMEQIMADILTESEEISPDLLFLLLASVLKENKKVAPSCWKLGEKLISDCAAKLRPILRGALQSKGTTLDDYSPVVAFVCRNESATEHDYTNGSPKRGVTDSAVSKGLILPRERGAEPSPLMRPKEGYNLSWLHRDGQTTRQRQNRRMSISKSNLTAVPTVSSRKRRIALNSNVEIMREEATVVPSDLKKMRLPTKGGSNTNNSTLRESGMLAGVIVGRRIKVWWPLDRMFYNGLIQSYDPIKKKHKVLYDDGDEENLNLEKERWEFIGYDLPDEILHRQEADNPKPLTSPVLGTKQSGGGKSSQSMEILKYKENFKRAGSAIRLPKVEAPDSSNQNTGGDKSSDGESNDNNVFEIRARSKDVQQESPNTSTSDDSTPEASPPRAIRVRSKDVQTKNPTTSTYGESTPEGSPLRYIRSKSKDVWLQSTSNDSTPEASPPRPWGLMRIRSWCH